MNPDTHIPTPEIQAPSPQPATCNSQPPTSFAHGRPNGKIARLPKPVRDHINHWLLDEVAYPDIIQRLDDHGKDLTPDNISQWKKRKSKSTKPHSVKPTALWWACWTKSNWVKAPSKTMRTKTKNLLPDYLRGELRRGGPGAPDVLADNRPAEIGRAHV